MPLLPTSLHNSSSWKDGIFLKIVNVIVYVVFLGFNVETLGGPHWGWHHYAKDTYITPAYWAWYVWTAIHTLLLGYIVYQFFPAAKKTIVDGVGWRFPAVVVLNSIYAALWNRGHTVAAFIFSILVSAAVSHTYYHVKVHHAPDALTEEAFIHWPFGLWHGWTTFLVILTGFEAFGTSTSYHAGIWTKVFVFISLLFLESTSAGYAFGNKDGDIAGSAAITWTLFAIYDHQHRSDFIHWSALVFAVLSLVWVGRAAFQMSQRGRRGIFESERAPLIGGH
ncbi:hypothetical protein BKA62DRAFT_770665 [Auriculariales sp. MPI-PUGE-AT-0066]|nr:hypothetical protein BKA62DRAFT_770665 [Auriculariales sp. MPI-PUGE-AT-0066]